MRLAADVRAAAVRDERWQVRGGARRDVLNERRGDHSELHLCIVHIRAFGVVDSKTRRAASSVRATAGSVHWRRGSFITRDLYVMADLVVSLRELLEAEVEADARGDPVLAEVDDHEGVRALRRRGARCETHGSGSGARA